ncbi:class I SAM-dependent methyltransferase [Virgibacillus sediminis]|uniref:Uncharacterized methyltransferase ACFODW_12160 n=1 Tax=Virgibacillus sediminis TaxID=202260 RepID=A0ABV7A7T9_9BACI
MGREFIEIFEGWAADYDKSVAGEDPQYAAVFHRYDEILQEVADRVKGTVLEFGTGTGNLAKKMMEVGHEVIGIEPSHSMRTIARGKFPNLTVLDGDFLTFPDIGKPVDTVASSYAFHHLSKDEKEKAVQQFGRMLPPGGRIIFADTMFRSEEEHDQAVKDARSRGFAALANDLEREFYPYTGDIKELFEKNGWKTRLERMNDFVWLLEAVKEQIGAD